ncbi:MAG: hypothetical protein ACI9GW_003138 [Halieaceae bacterium]|jgi:hypothetical protein
MIRYFLLSAAVLTLLSCKHPLAIVGDGDIVNLVDGSGTYGCTLEQFKADDPKCTGFDFTEDYLVNFEARPREGWHFSHWEGPCRPDSEPPLCRIESLQEWYEIIDDLLDGEALPTTTAVFEETDSDSDGVPDNSDAFPDDPLEFADVDCDGLGDNSDPQVVENVTTLLGERCGEGIHLYILADGYTAAEQDKIGSDAAIFIEFVLADPGIADYVLQWNIHAIQTVSAESGVDPNYGVNIVDSAFGAGFNCVGIPRLVCADDSLVLGELHKVTTDVDAIPVLMVNSTEYGGSGGSYPIYSTAAVEVALHEMGHSFVDLSDEYFPDEATAAIQLPFWREGRFANSSQFSTVGEVPWKVWIDDADNVPSLPGEVGIGIFEGGFYHSFGFYRPADRTRMRFNDADFGPVNSEAWILESYRRTGAISDSEPTDRNVIVAPGEAIKLTIDLSYGNSVQSTAWQVNGAVQLNAADSSSVTFSSTDPGSYLIEVAVVDNSGAVRLDAEGLTSYSRDWLLEVVAP